jgi:hypothetical protein
MNGQEPAITQQDPRAYYYWLLQNRVPNQQAMALVDQRFKGGTTPQQRQQQEARAKQTSGLAQTGGAVAGLIASRYIYNNAKGWIDSLTGAKTTEAVVQNAANQAGQSGAVEAAKAGGTSFAPTPALDQAMSIPQNGAVGAGQPIPQGMEGVGTSAQGGTMVKVETPAGPQSVPQEALNDPGFWDSVNWGQVAQGGLALAQLYGAYKQYKSGDTAGAAIIGASAAGNLATSGLLGASTASGASSLAGGYLIPGLNILAAGYTGYQTAEAMSDMAAGKQRDVLGVTGGAAAGAGIGTAILPGIGTAIGAAVGAIAGYAGSKFGSGKKKPQMMRDSIRGVLQKNGVLDDKFQGTLADGSKYDFGKDGSTLKWSNIDKIAAKTPNAWNAAVPAADALAASYGFVGQKASDIAAWYAKGAVSNAGDDPTIALQNMQHFAKQQGITYDMIKTKLDEAMADNRINQQMYDKYITGAAQLTGQSGPNITSPTQEKIARPKAGQLARVSPGMYMNSKGQVGRENEMRKSLEKNMRK